MSIELFPRLSDKELDQKVVTAIPDDDMKKVLTTGKVDGTEFSDVKENILDEYSGESNYEPYTGIILDPEDNSFKTTSGMFRDKKEFYEKLTARGYVVRKVFEKKVFDWIEENAKTTLEAYLMFSTAFSKWKGNNLLNDYYTKLLNDIPQLNRERIKGNPNTRGNTQEESTLTEKLYTNSPEEASNWPTKKITVTPVIERILSSEDREKQCYKPQEYTKCKIPPIEIATSMNVNEFLKRIVDLNNNTLFITSLYEDMNGGSYQVKDDPLFIDADNIKDSPKLFTIKIDGYGTIRVNNEISNKQGGRLTFDDSFSPFILRNTKVFDMAKDIGILGQNVNDINPSSQQYNLDKANDIQKKISTLLSNSDSSDPEIQAIYNELTDTVSQLKANVGKLIADNPKHILTASGWENLDKNIEEIRNQYFELEKDKIALSTKYWDKEKQNPVSDSEYENLLNKYNSNNAKQAFFVIQNDINNILNHVQELAKNKIPSLNDLINNTEKSINEINLLINDKEKQPGNDTNIAYDQIHRLKEKLNKQINKLKELKIKKQKNINNKNNSSDKIRTFNFDIPSGYKASLNTTQDELNVGNGIHGKKESIEDKIPVVDDIIPGKHVNYNATLGYMNQPVDGVITNPGAIPSSGQFMYEQDEHWGWVHEELNQELFDGTRLRPEIREALLRIANKFKDSLGLNIEPVDVYFTGSSANFNYNDSSDIDLHLVYDFEEIGINAEILVKYFIAKKQVFNNDYEITIKGIPVELGVENINEPIVSSAVYSLIKDSWLLEPEYAEQLLPQPDMKQYYDIVQEIEKAIETKDSAVIGKVWDKLYDIRKKSLADEGEYGKGNALFKKLRNLGYLNRLKNAYYSSASDELSLESLKEI